jgi:hypothetical protein
MDWKYWIRALIWLAGVQFRKRPTAGTCNHKESKLSNYYKTHKKILNPQNFEVVTP